jgi:hypothetical protein
MTARIPGTLAIAADNMIMPTLAPDALDSPSQQRLEITSQPFPSFNSQVLDQQLARYQAYVQVMGVPDSLIVGSSRALQGIDPIALQQALARQGYPQRRIYNFGVNGATAQVVELLLRQLLPPEQLPRLIVWADGARALNSGRSDRTYEAIQRSLGYRHLQAGNYPTRMSARSATVVVYSACRESISTLNESSPPPFCPPGVLRFTLPSSQPPQMASDLRVASGFSVVSNRFSPATYYQRFPRIAGQYDGDYRSFTLQGAQSEATVRVARWLRSRGVALIFVNLPLTDDYLDPVRRSRDSMFRSHMLSLARQEGFWFRNLDRGALKQPGYFADPSHLNQFGAIAVAEQLAKDPTIPW